MGPIFLVLAKQPISSNKIIISKFFAEIWKHGNFKKKFDGKRNASGQRMFNFCGSTLSYCANCSCVHIECIHFQFYFQIKYSSFLGLSDFIVAISLCSQIFAITVLW